MAIEFGRVRKGKRIAVVDLQPTDIREVFVGSGYHLNTDRGVIVFTEQYITGQSDLLNISIRQATEENTIIIWFSSKEAVEKLEKHLAKIKRLL